MEHGNQNSDPAAQRQTTAPLRINMTHVEELMSGNIAWMTTGRFRFNMSAQNALDLMTAAYRTMVEFRHRKFILDDNTTNGLIAFAKYITQKVPKFGVMLCGTCGNGKTTMLYAFQRAINHLNNRGHFRGIVDYRVGMEIMTAKEIAERSKDIKDFKEICTRDMLAIDDMGAEAGTVQHYGNNNTPLVDLLEYRYNRQLFTCITTNLTGKELHEKYGERVYDRLREMLQLIVFEDISYRK